MRIITNEIRDEVSIMGLKDQDYTILIGALKAAVKNDSLPGNEYILVYGADRDEVRGFCERFLKEEDKLWAER